MARVVFKIVVDNTDVNRIFGALTRSIDTPSLADFMEDKVHPWWKVAETERFVVGGDAVSGQWDELSPATQNIREYLGFPPDNPINVRTGLMLDELLDSYDIGYLPGGASITIPGRGTDPLTAEKIRTAQAGKTGMTPSGYEADTPPRPVLNITEADAAAILTALNLHIYEQIASGLL